MQKPTQMLMTLALCLVLSAFGCSTNNPATKRGPSSPTLTTPEPRASLQIEAQIVYGVGGPQPVAREAFSLLDTNWAGLLPTDKASPSDKADGPSDMIAAFAAREGLSVKEYVMKPLILALLRKNRDYDVETFKDLMNQFGTGLMGTEKYWKPHVIQEVETDFQGRANFQTVAPGNYWLMGIGETRGGFAYWNYEVSVKPGENRVLLD